MRTSSGALRAAHAGPSVADGGARPGTAGALIGTTRAFFAAGPEYGPSKGTLLIVGGGQLDGSGIYEKFIELAGGPSAKIVVVPTAGGNKRGDGTPIVYHADTVLASWRKMGLTHVHMLHTHDPAVATTPACAELLRDARAGWFVGGRQWNIVDSYAKH
jgi:cyanophycinase